MPIGMQLSDWADRLVYDLSAYDAFAPLIGDDWKTWAAQFARNSAIGYQVPNPDQFTEWQDWAERLCGALA